MSTANELLLRLHALEDVLREFILDVESASDDATAQDWPDLYVTYQKAKRLIEGEPL